jgi:tRNA A37 methylthiotransferase MiaB
MSPTRAATFYLRSFGCQMNDHDAERIVGMLQQIGLTQCDAPEDAGVLVYNTCSIREKADSRLAGHLGLVARLKREDPSRLVVITGCLPQSLSTFWWVRRVCTSCRVCFTNAWPKVGRWGPFKRRPLDGLPICRA